MPRKESNVKTPKKTQNVADNKVKGRLKRLVRNTKPSVNKPPVSNGNPKTDSPDVDLEATTDEYNSDTDIGKSETESGIESVVRREIKTNKMFAEQCILSNSKTKIHTSDHTLATLKENKLDFSTLQSLLKSTPESHINEKKAITKEHESQFDKWLDLTHQNFNIMLYGVGSKINLLDKFLEEKLKDRAVVVIHGFFPSLNIKLILNSITEDIIDHKGTFSSPQAQAEFIVQNLNSDLYLIVHNIDSATLNTEKTTPILCQLARCKKIHFIASVDHVNSGLIWDSNRASCFHFLWFDVTNFSMYRMENAYENSFLLKQNNTLVLSSLQHVFCCLTPNAQGIFLLLARAHLNQSSTDQNGLSFKDLFRQCRESFLVNSDLTLRAQLREFKDHNLVKVRKGQDGQEYLQVTIDARTLKEFVDDQE